MEFTIEKLHSKPKYLIIECVITFLSLVLIPIVLPEGNLSHDEIKNLGNLVYSSDAENDLKDFSLIPEDNYASVSGTVTVTVADSNGEITAIRQALG